MEKDFARDKKRKSYDSKALPVRRVAKVTKGGRRLRFSTVVVVGDRKGSVGVALGRGSDVKGAIDQGERLAAKKMKKIELVGDTIPHEILHKHGAAKVLLRPARTGTGVIAGSSVRTVLELAGIDNVYGKILGTQEANSNAYCTFEALVKLRKGRVLEKMQIMRERVHIKEEMDKEKQIREDKKRKEKKQKRREESGGKKLVKKNKVSKKK
ncbi:MAG: 30S ribosomal protein S5 [Candidatus Dojkabacteria bacterium]|jgi:small subunit ribosomal protein S5|nr:30S ribosomal protein S5 [Candidatus Dojkabacteria bacterium]MDD4561277.1 30S ribosomal protein S5 [Candidatus Dojkabacteria bacterium]NLB12343.1 30S ribosomal protein S5 [Candidatus Dojkabacteria bacterium]